MKKFIILFAFFTIFNSLSVSAEISSASAKSELTQLYKLYDESDYRAENWDLLTDAYQSGISAIENSETEDEIIQNLNIAAEQMISIEHRGGSVEVCISTEKLTIKKGFITMPELYRVAKYERASQVISDFLTEKFENKTKTPFKASGKIEHNFELTGIFENYIDTGDDEYDEIDVPSYLRKYVGTSLPQRADKGYIRAGDYTPGSCFVLSVNNKFPNVYASGIPVLEEDVLRWQFSIYGNGADVGSNAYDAENKIENFADKSELLYEFARLHKINDIEVLLSDENNLKKYNDILQVLEIATISQTAVKKALNKLETIIPSAEITPKPTHKEEIPATPEPIPEATPNPTPIPDAEEAPAKPEIVFSDVAESHFATDYINHLVANKIISGRSDRIFDPEGKVTRAEFSAMLSRTENIQFTENKNIFDDVPDTAWYRNAVLYAYNTGVTNGTGENSFSPENFITREDISTMLLRYCKHRDFPVPSGTQINFSDNSKISEYATEAVGVMQKLGIINGKDNNLFDPKGFATRAETAKMLSLLLQMISE